MANSIDWGKVYCSMFDNSAWGDDPNYTTVAITDVSATADSTLFTADATLKP